MQFIIFGCVTDNFTVTLKLNGIKSTFLVVILDHKLIKLINGKLHGDMIEMC